jgi:hypothetical protein
MTQDVNLGVDVGDYFAVIRPSGQSAEFADTVPRDDEVDRTVMELYTRDVVDDRELAEVA